MFLVVVKAQTWHTAYTLIHPLRLEVTCFFSRTVSPKRLLGTPQGTRSIGIRPGACHLRCKTAHACYSEIQSSDIPGDYGREGLQTYIDLGYMDIHAQ